MILKIIYLVTNDKISHIKMVFRTVLFDFYTNRLLLIYMLKNKYFFSLVMTIQPIYFRSDRYSVIINSSGPSLYISSIISTRLNNCICYFVALDFIAGVFFSPGILAISNLSLGLNRVAGSSIPMLVVRKFFLSLFGA